MEPEQMELSPEELEKQSAEDFEAGRMAARGEIGEELHKESEVDEKANTVEGDLPPAPESEEKSPVFIAGLTEEELKQALVKANKYDTLAAQLTHETGKIYGKFGEIQSKLNQLAGGKKISKEDLKRVTESWGPEFAEDLAADLAALSVGGEAPDMAAVLEGMNQEFATQLEAVNIKMLTMAKPKWKETIASPDWDLFLGTLPLEKKQEIEATVDPTVAMQALNAFDEWAGRGSKKEDKKEEKNKRLLRAVTPRGNAPELPEKSMSDDAAFEAGRTLARKRIGLTR